MEILNKVNDMIASSMKRIENNQLYDKEFEVKSRSYEEGYIKACQELREYLNVNEISNNESENTLSHGMQPYIITKISEYSDNYLLTLLTHECVTSLILKNKNLFPSDVDGKLIVDLLLKTGTEDDRFLVVDIHRGIVDYKNYNIISSSGNIELEKTANKILAQHPAIILSSLLSNAEKVKILHTDY